MSRGPATVARSRTHALFHVLAAGAKIVTRFQLVIVLRGTAGEAVALIRIHLVFG